MNDEIVSLKKINKESKILDDKQEFDRIRKEIAKKLENSLLPSFKRLLNSLLNDNELHTVFIITPRNIGKTYNMSMVTLILMLLTNQDATSVRKHKTKVKGSIAKSFANAIINHAREFEEYFIFGKESVQFKVGVLRLVLTLDGVANPLGFKGTEDKILWVDEAQQFSQEDFSLIMPSIRGTGSKRIVTSNIPVDGKKSWLYKEFVEQQPEGHKYVELSFEDNPITFPDPEAVEMWRESQRPYFRGRQGAFEREIDGIWQEASEYNIFKNWRIIETPDLKPNIFIMLYESGIHFSLGIHMRDEQIAIVGEYYEPLSSLSNNIDIVLHSHNMSNIVQKNDDLLTRSVTSEPCTLDKLAGYFAMNEILIESSCELVAEEISLASFDIQDDDIYLVDKLLTKNIKGLVVRSLQILVGWLD